MSLLLRAANIEAARGLFEAIWGNIMASTIPWRMHADYMETCNCDFGCPCNFNGFPTGGRCEALVGYHIRAGRYGETSLDGLDFIYAASWPRAIHEGNGTVCHPCGWL